MNAVAAMSKEGPMVFAVTVCLRPEEKQLSIFSPAVLRLGKTLSLSLQIQRILPLAASSGRSHVQREVFEEFPRLWPVSQQRSNRLENGSVCMLMGVM